MLPLRPTADRGVCLTDGRTKDDGNTSGRLRANTRLPPQPTTTRIIPTFNSMWIFLCYKNLAIAFTIRCTTHSGARNRRATPRSKPSSPARSNGTVGRCSRQRITRGTCTRSSTRPNSRRRRILGGESRRAGGRSGGSKNVSLYILLGVYSMSKGVDERLKVILPYLLEQNSCCKAVATGGGGHGCCFHSGSEGNNFGLELLVVVRIVLLCFKKSLPLGTVSILRISK